MLTGIMADRNRTIDARCFSARPRWTRLSSEADFSRAMLDFAPGQHLKVAQCWACGRAVRLGCRGRIASLLGRVFARSQAHSENKRGRWAVNEVRRSRQPQGRGRQT
jgi:hypothetical protein